MTMLAVAAISARTMAEAAVRDGYTVTALDLFGDTDTRAASVQWWPLGEPGSLRMDASRLQSALVELARGGEVLGWVPGAGFEGRPDLLEQGAAVLPLIGNYAAVVHRVRDPQTFFGALDRFGVPYPEVRVRPPEASDEGGAWPWLVKDARGTGGWHIRRWTAALVPKPSPPASSLYFQREARGVPMSATFIANGADACVLGFNELTTRRFGAKPWVFCGVVGPVTMPAAAARQIQRALRDLVAEFDLRGLGSLDFLLDGESVSVLEINPRPPASMALYEATRFCGASAPATHGLMEAHLRACLHGELPVLGGEATEFAVRGIEIVYARRPTRVTLAMADGLSQWPGAHDLPAVGTPCTPGDPLCCVSAADATIEAVKGRLIHSRKALLNSLES